MKLKNNKKLSSLLLCMMLIVAMALTAGCGEKKQENTSAGQEVSVNVSDGVKTQESTSEEQEEASNVLGEGSTQFTFTVVDGEGKETVFEIHTDKTTVGDALLELGLIAGDAGEFGLYVKTVNGITADYDVDQTYWAFYINGEYGMTGVDVTNIEAGATYSFKVEK